MRILRKPLSILLSIIMILSVYTIIPMTTAGAAEVTATVYRWVKGEMFINGSFTYDFGNLFNDFAFYGIRSGVAPTLEADRSATIVMSSSDDLTRPATVFENGYKYVLDHNAFAYQGKQAGTWEDYYYGTNPKVYVEADRYVVDGADLWAYTWKDNVSLSLTEHPAVEPTETTDGNVLYYTGADGKYYLPDRPDFYREVSAEDVVIRRLREETSYIDLRGNTQEKLALRSQGEHDRAE